MPEVKFEDYAQGTQKMDGRGDWFFCGGVFVENYDSLNVKGWIYLE